MLTSATCVTSASGVQVSVVTAASLKQPDGTAEESETRQQACDSVWQQDCVTNKREVARLWQHEREAAVSMRQQQVFGIMQR